MDKSRIAHLITEAHEEDAYGVLQTETARRKVFVSVQSVSQSEWFEGGRNGLNPELKFTMFSFDYKGESMIEYNGVVYTVYRTYLTNRDEIELYVQRKQGNVKNYYAG